VPDILIISGPNGAGKTTFAREYLSAQEIRFEFVNADEIARGLDSPSDILAARIMLARITALVDAQANFAIETTLASLSYAQKILAWQKRGYVVSLIFIGLGSAAESVARVRKRVEAGGHNIPEAILRRRFSKSRRYFETIYKPIVNSWYEWESREGVFSLIDSGDPK
jgi:predicted ABC-type ATPase